MIYDNTFNRIKRDISINRSLYLIILPVMAYYIIFKYAPMYGSIIAFKNFSPGLGIMNSPWAGFTHFSRFFNSIYFERLLKNTLLLSLYSIIFGFPVPIILALLINEVRSSKFKRSVQTISYIPHFISMIVIVGLIRFFVGSDGLINDFLTAIFNVSRSNLLMQPKNFRAIYIASGIWQEAGWGSIIYLAALSNISYELYEAAIIDGANRWKQTIHITIPGISSTVIILFILRTGSLLSVGFEKIILLYSPATYQTADVISTYVYRMGLLNFDWSYSTAVGLFNSVINFGMLVMANKFSKRFSEISLW